MRIIFALLQAFCVNESCNSNYLCDLLEVRERK